MYYDILDEKRKKILPLMATFKEDFYLAGGTALALHIGHRDSVDFDFFTEGVIDVEKLLNKVKEVFSSFYVVVSQKEENTLTVVIDEDIQLSFFGYKYPVIHGFVEGENLRIASIFDIACMKLSAITGRATDKDYIDLYFIIKDFFTLSELLEGIDKKFGDLYETLVLKGLVYFDDIEKSKIIFKNNKEVSFEEVKKFLKEKVHNLLL